MRLALGDDGGTEPVAKVVGEFVELGVAVDLDGLLGGIADDVAVVTPGEVIFQFGLSPVVEYAVEVIGQLLQKFRAFHCLPSPLSRFWK